MKMSRKYKNILIYFLIIIYTVIYRLYVYTKLLKYNEGISAVFFILLLAISIYMLGYRKVIETTISKKIFKSVLIAIGLYFVITYGIGLITGFLTNSYSLKLTGIIDNTLALLISIIACEIFRYVFISANKDNIKSIVIVTILLTIFDINLLIRYNSFNTFENIFKFISISVVPIAMQNIMCSYITYKANYKASMIYKIIMELYVYIVPIQPDLSDYLLSVFNLILPFSIFMFLSNNKDGEKVNYTPSKLFEAKRDLPFIGAIAIVFLMVLGIGPFQIIGIETSSMTPNINVGDAVIIDKMFNKNKLEEGDIIAYINKDGVLVVHRIIKINSDKTFITKGDYNNAPDSHYVGVDDIKGKVRLKIPFIAYPAIMFK